MAQKITYPTSTQRSALPGQLPIPGVGGFAALFADKEPPGPSASDRRAVQMSVQQLIESWRKYMDWDRRTMGRVLRDVMSEYE